MIKSWLNSLNDKERCFNAFSLIPINIGYTEPSFRREKR